MIVPDQIDVDIVEAILKENNGLELQWLQNLLESGIKVMGTKGRCLQTKKFLDRINKVSPVLGERQDRTGGENGNKPKVA